MNAARSEGEADDARPDAHTALLSSTIGQVVVAITVFVMGIWVVGPNIPASPAREIIDVVWWPAPQAGFDQNWAVFSPNPRSQTIEVRARLEFADGSRAEWTVPDFDPIIGAYRSYRWRKWQERVRLDANSSYWESSAAWIAGEHRRDGELPTTVRLVRRWQDHDALTADGATDGIENEFEFYVWTSDQ